MWNQAAPPDFLLSSGKQRGSDIAHGAMELSFQHSRSHTPTHLWNISSSLQGRKTSGFPEVCAGFTTSLEESGEEQHFLAPLQL